MFYIIIAILAFGVLIALHEFGHFATAKLLGVRVNEFAIGMGPLLLSKQTKETQYSLRLLPIGGYCAMEGEDEASDDPRAFTNQAGWKKFVILVAGAFMNLLTGFLIVLVLYQGIATFSTNTVAAFMDGFPLEGEAGLMAGDRIVKINGVTTRTYHDVSLQLNRGEGESMDLVVLRDGKRLELDDFPLSRRDYGEEGLKFGVYFAKEENTPLAVLQYSAWDCLYFVKLVWYGLCDLVTGAAGLNDLAGPIGIVESIGTVGNQAETMAAGVWNVCYYIALIAVNLAVMNLLPLPALDGGRVFFLLVNGLCALLFRRKIPEKYEGYVHMAGMAMLLALMAVVAFHDIWRIVTG